MNKDHLTGLSSELYAASWFSRKGWEVYFPLATQSRCDFLVETKGAYKKVQVKTASWSKSGKFKYLQVRLSSQGPTKRKFYDETDFDYIVFVDYPRIWVAPFSEIEGKTSICLDSTNPEYKIRDKSYDPDSWRLDN